MTKKKEALEKTGGTALAIVGGQHSVGDLLASTLGGEEITPFDLGRIRLPSGGGTFWTVPDLDNEDGRPEKHIEGVVVATRGTRVYWEKSYDDGEKGPPDCSSRDCKTGTFEGGQRECAGCPFNEWGSGRNGGKACKEQRELYVLSKDATLPDLVVLPPSSLKPWKKFLVGLVRFGVPLNSIVVRMGLKKAQNDQGVDYSEATFAKAETLEAGDAAASREYGEQFSRHVMGFDVVDSAAAAE